MIRIIIILCKHQSCHPRFYTLEIVKSLLSNKLIAYQELFQVLRTPLCKDLVAIVSANVKEDLQDFMKLGFSFSAFLGSSSLFDAGYSDLSKERTVAPFKPASFVYPYV